MSTLKVEYHGPQRSGNAKAKGQRPAGSGRRRPRRLPLRLLRWAVFAVILAIVPFFLLIRGGVFAYQQWGLGPWPSLAVSAAATALLLVLYAWALGRRLGAGKELKWLMTRGAAALAVAYVAYSVVYVGSANVKSEEVRAEYAALHPLLRLAASAVILADQGAVITDASRTPDFYRRMGLSPIESSLHFQQEDGFVHALDLRTVGRPEWRNRAIELTFRALGFNTLRHVGTADHLHVSVRSPG
ncbi:MAG: hypothetical protein OXN18_00750 [Gemmatimonadota bacterium]|nr:hypothetical protein [Gemmatimonadota bacterium]